MRRSAVVVLFLLGLITSSAQAQYFGRNKVQWEHFDFKILRTEHFDIYYYDREADVVNDVGRQAERWYARLSRVFNHSFTHKPIVLYANPADFQQTTTSTEMWIRDATIHNKMPDIVKLTRDPYYFPYRYGQALLAYVGGRFGDDAVVRLFLAAGSVGPEASFERATGIPAKQIFTDWQESAREMYNPVAEDRPFTLGQPIIGSKRGIRGYLNLGPAFGPDAKYIAFLSTRDVFDIDLFLADAQSGKVLRQLASATRNQHFEALRFIDSAGAWSPDSKQLAFVVFEKGDNYLAIENVEGGRIRDIHVPGIDAINNVAWSPDGHTIAISGQKTGVSDLFLYNVDTNQVRQLTNDRYADMQPEVSPDGKLIA